MRLREWAIPILDLRIHFRKPATYNLTTPILAVMTGAEASGLVVDEVDDLAYDDADQLRRQ
jgi:chemotaxis signal transduction protein